MKYTIEGFQQKILIEYGLDCLDAVILRYIIDFWQTGKMQIFPEDNVHKNSSPNEYFWMNYSTIINELPILAIEKQALSKRMKKFVVCGLLNKRLWKYSGGTYTYFRFVPGKYERLITYIPTDTKISVATDTKIPPIYSSTSNNSSTNNTDGSRQKSEKNIIPPSLEMVKKYLESVNEKRFTAIQFMDHYESNGWMIGKNKMKDWQAAIRTWQHRSHNKPADQEPTVSDERIAEICAEVDKKYGKKK